MRRQAHVVRACVMLALLLAGLLVVFPEQAQAQAQTQGPQGQAQAQAQGRRVALVIGNNKYKNVSALINPSNDANDVSTSLQRLGFSVRRVLDATFDEMRKGLLDFARNARGSDVAIVFFAGHGIEVGGENYLIPVDAELKADVDVDHEAIALKNILPLVENASKLGLVILDACRNNPFASKMQRTIRTRAVSRGLAAIEPTGNVLVAFAAKEGTTAADGEGRNSPFTASLLRHLETPGLEINFLFRNVRDDVIQSTRREQQPFIYGSLSKEAIYLKAALPVPAPPVVQGPGADEVTWSLLKETHDAEALRRFIAQFPKSSLRREAEQRIAAIDAEAAAAAAKAAAQPKLPAPDEVVWNLVKDTRDPAQLKLFLSQFPNSGHRAEAERRLAVLNAEAAAAAAALAEAARKPQAPSGPAPEEVAWNLVKETRDPQQLALFLRQFPKSGHTAEAEKRIASLNAEAAAAAKAAETAKATAARLDERELARSLQLELKRVGCFDGAVNGEFGAPTREALRSFAKFAAVNIGGGSELSQETLSAIRRHDSRICPLKCGTGEKADGERCVRIVCAAGQILKDGACVNDPSKKTATPERSAPASGGTKCFTFNNRRFCE